MRITASLLSNASQYTPSGGSINISLDLADEEGFLQLTVVDTGLPISAERTSCGQSFRTESIRLAKAQGSDLELYATRSLVELHGGRFWFESGADRGGIFHVTFPIAEQLTVMTHETTTTTDARTTCLKGE
jgi:signal transduction histidine kinase